MARRRTAAPRTARVPVAATDIAVGVAGGSVGAVVASRPFVVRVVIVVDGVEHHPGPERILVVAGRVVHAAVVATTVVVAVRRRFHLTRLVNRRIDDRRAAVGTPRRDRVAVGRDIFDVHLGMHDAVDGLPSTLGFRQVCPTALEVADLQRLLRRIAVAKGGAVVAGGLGMETGLRFQIDEVGLELCSLLGQRGQLAGLLVGVLATLTRVGHTVEDQCPHPADEEEADDRQKTVEQRVAVVGVPRTVTAAGGVGDRASRRVVQVADRNGIDAFNERGEDVDHHRLAVGANRPRRIGDGLGLVGDLLGNRERLRSEALGGRYRHHTLASEVPEDGGRQRIDRAVDLRTVDNGDVDRLAGALDERPQLICLVRRQPRADARIHVDVGGSKFVGHLGEISAVRRSRLDGADGTDEQCRECDEGNHESLQGHPLSCCEKNSMPFGIAL